MRFRFGSFNMMNMGKTALTKRDFARIAEIIRKEQFDVVAFQEILSQGQSLEYLLKHSLPGWDMRWAEPKESSDYSLGCLFRDRALQIHPFCTPSGSVQHENRTSFSPLLRFALHLSPRSIFQERNLPQLHIRREYAGGALCADYS